MNIEHNFYSADAFIDCISKDSGRYPVMFRKLIMGNEYSASARHAPSQG